MNIQEFAALKPGDVIENHASNSRGTVTEAKPTGVHVRWGEKADGSVITFFYSHQGIAWFQWSKVEAPTPVDAIQSWPDGSPM